MDRADRHRLEGVTLYRFWLPVGNTGMSASLDVQEGHTNFHQSVIQRARPLQVGPTPIKIAAPEDMILLKLIASRPIDLADASELVRIVGEELDPSYLWMWAKELSIENALEASLSNHNEHS